MSVKTTVIEKKYKDKATGEWKSTSFNYAKVADRIKEFREECPNGIIETVPNFKDDGVVYFSCRILKDKANTNSGEATGNSFGKVDNDKVFEKLETIAVGRALAMLGYMSSGEVASSEEMEEFNAYRDSKIEDAIFEMGTIETLEELKKYYMSLGNFISDSRIIEAKDKRKAEIAAKESK